jgi:hypothetical protein
MKNLLYYGNCQVGSLNNIIKKSFSDYNITIVLCWMDNIDKNDFLNKIQQADIIITQPINPNYKNTNYLHTEFILENANENAKIIIFPSLHFNFYYFDLKYKTLKDNTLLREPSDYHYGELINYYLENKSEIDFFNEIIENPTFKLTVELENIAIDSINELEKRENEISKYNNIRECLIIKSSKFIEENYKKKLLFYSMNHPAKYIFHYIAELILDHLSIDKNINYEIDSLYNHERGLLYNCIQQVVYFDISKENPRLHNYNLEDKNKIINKYYDTYKKNNLHNIQ